MNRVFVNNIFQADIQDFSIINPHHTISDGFSSFFSHINIFIGENNSGKSLLMRALAEAKIESLSSDEMPVGETGPPPVKYYIPILRGLRGFKKTVKKAFEAEMNSSYRGKIPEQLKDLYFTRTFDDYFKSSSQIQSGSLRVFTGLEMYERIRDMMLGDPDERRTIEVYKRFLSNEFFDCREVELIPRVKEDVLYIRIGDEEEQPIYRAGDGIQALLVITFPIFLERGNPTVFFIEKPETYMHPGIQKKLIKILSESRFRDNHQYFITTHSFHILEIAGEYPQVSVFKTSRNNGREEKIESAPLFSIERVFHTGEKVADLPGIINPSLYLPNCLIWVRGSAEKFYVRKILEEYQSQFLDEEDLQRFQEDSNYLFVEFGKDDMSRIIPEEDDFFSHEMGDENSNRVFMPPSFLVAGKHKEQEVSTFRKLIEESGGDSYLYQANRIESLMPLDTVVEIIRQYEGEDFELKIKPDDYKRYPNELMGNFIEERFFGFSLFKDESEILDWDAFLNSLEEPRDKEREHLWDFLDTECQRQINHHQIDVKSRYLFINDLNSILKKKNFYDEEIFNSIEFNDEIKSYLKKGINQLVRYEIQKLNRLLLEAMYPDIIRKKRDIEAESPRCNRKGGYADKNGLLSISPIRFVRQASAKLGPSFIPSDITNWKSLVKILKMHKSPDVERVWNFLDNDIQKLINDLDVKEDVGIKDKRKIVNAFNKMLDTRKFFDEKIFDTGNLSQNCAGKQLQDLRNFPLEKLRRFHRALLVLTFPQEIRPAFDKLNRESKDLAKKLYDFVKKHNK